MAKRNRTLLFDFDGTIADTMHTILGIYNGIVAPSYNCKPLPPEKIEEMRNAHSRDVMHEYNVTIFKLPFMIMRARKELSRRIDAIEPKTGIVEAIKALKAKNCGLGILTQNSRKNVHYFFKKHGLENAFDFVYTSLFAFNKHKVIRKILRKWNISPSELIYIGDETRDIDAAKKAGIKVAAVTWGYNKPEALAARNPDYLITSTTQLLALIQRR